MALTFLQFKEDLLDRLKSTEINQFYYLFNKASNWSEIITLLKNTESWSWSFNNGVIDFDLIDEIPVLELESQNIYNSVVSLTDINSTTIIILKDGDLTLVQNNQNKCKILLLGGSLNGTTNDESMIELESYLDSSAELELNDTSFVHINQTGSSSTDIIANDSSVVKLLGFDDSVCDIDLQDTSFLNAKIQDKFILNYDQVSTNSKIEKRDEAEANTTPI